MSPTRIELRNGESAIFGYGSLLLRSQMELTLKRVYDRPFLSCMVGGWMRTWDVIMPNKSFYMESTCRIFPENIIYLNIRPKADSLLNGVLFVVSPEDLAAFDRREWIYNRQVITDDIRDIQVSGGEAFAYVAKPEHILPQDADLSYAAIRRSYLDIVEAGLHYWGPSFREIYNSSTQPTPWNLVMNDHKVEDGTNPLLAETRRPAPPVAQS